MEEVWKDIEGYEGLYEVSNFGRIKSLRTGKIMKPSINRGYLKCILQNDGKYKMYYVHRLVIQTFIPNPDNLPEVNHKDEDKTNNKVDNLEWCDHKYNTNFGTRNEKIRNTLLKKHLCIKNKHRRKSERTKTYSSESSLW